VSAFTTLYITRTKALSVIAEHLLADEHSDNMLEDMMDRILRDKLYNCIIVDDDTRNDDLVI
jgi:hypothetical protein